jgi:dTDP-4-dehydrorhamnose reductase
LVKIRRGKAGTTRGQIGLGGSRRAAADGQRHFILRTGDIMTDFKPLDLNSPLEMWGGLECSCVRVASGIRDQQVLNGHLERLDDLDRFASLGIKALRYPVLWDHHHGRSVDWTSTDERLGRLRELGIRPIIGFVHHGGGPLPGGLLDPNFVAELAAFARCVAERYPWVDAYTPVNEPATTARFSGLYGFWHPFGRDVRSFGQCFLNECLATRAAMKAIREVNSGAQLIQTEDLGKVHSTPRLEYQAVYENERRWLTFDVLEGRVDPSHPVYAHMVDCGVSCEMLRSFVDDPCPPDVLGMNYYVTSERFLDEHLHRYPSCRHGGNGRDAYADIDAVRVRSEGIVGFRGLLEELWTRYRRPIAITEVQLACSREEQVRWLVEAWEQANAARNAGADVRAITSWALLGSFDWDTLLVERRNSYECGAFDVRGGKPRRTAVGRAVEALAKQGSFDHPVLASPGWWRRPARLQYPPISAPSTGAGTAFAEEPRADAAPLLIVGAEQPFGRMLTKFAHVRGLHHLALTTEEAAECDDAALAVYFDRYRPWAAVLCPPRPAAAGNPATALDSGAARRLAAACRRGRAQLAMLSTHLVFDGASGRPRVESDLPNPRDHYGRAALAIEEQVRLAMPEAMTVRTGPLFAPEEPSDFAGRWLEALASGETVFASAETLATPSFAPDVGNALLDLLIDGETGVWHIANREPVSWFDFAATLAEAIGAERQKVRPAPAEGSVASYGTFAALRSERGEFLPPWHNALSRYVAALPDLMRTAAAA